MCNGVLCSENAFPGLSDPAKDLEGDVRKLTCRSSQDFPMFYTTGSTQAFSNQGLLLLEPLIASDYLFSACATPVQHLQGVAIDEANFIGGYANDRSVLAVQLEYVMVPSAAELSSVDPKLPERGKEGPGDLAVWMEEDVVGD